MTLRKRILLSLLAFLAIPLGVLGSILYDYLVDNMRQDLTREIHTVLEDVSYGFKTLQRHVRANLELFSHSSLLENYLKIQDSETRYEVMQLPLMNLFSSYTQAYPDYYEVRVLLPDGYEDTRHVLDDLANTTEEEGNTPLFKKIRSARERFVFLNAFNPDNQETAFFASQQLHFLLSDVDPDTVDSDLRGYLILTIRPEFLKNRVNRLHFGETGFIFFTDSTGTVLFKPRHVTMDKQVPEALFARLQSTPINAGLQEAVFADTPHLVQGMALLPNLYVYAALEKEEVYGDIHTIAMMVLGITVAGFILLLALLYIMLARLVIHPVSLLSDAVLRLGRGQYDIRLPTTRISEIRSLFETFNTMVGDLEVLHRRIEEHNQELEGRVTQRTRELQNTNQTLEQKITELMETRSRLLEASHEAERANQAKSIFLASMSHEIRSPMNGVLGMLELLLGSGLSSGQHDMAQMARRSAESLLAILNDILDFSKVEAGKITLEHIPFQLAEILELVTTLMASRAQEKGLEIYCEAHPLPRVPLLGDPTRLQQVLINLLGNAIKFTEQGEVSLQVWRETLPHGRLRLHFSVRDTGIGMAAATLDKLFQPFSQADTAITRRYGGTGLGLAISRKLVALMGGELVVTSRENHGSNFSFYIDFQMESQEDMPFSARGRQILLVNETPVAGHIVARILMGMGLEVTTLRHGADLPDMPRGDVAVVVMDPANQRDFHQRWQQLEQRVPATTPRILVSPMGILRDDVAGVRVIHRPILSFRLEEAIQGALSNQPIAVRHADEPARERQFQGHLLLAEDNTINQQVALEMLRRLGITADVAANGYKAVAMAGQQRYDLILMDMQMPEMDGLEATRRIRLLENGATRRPIVAMTANAMAQDRQACLEAGMDDFLSKPVRIRLLADILGRWLAPLPTTPGANPAVAAPTGTVVLDQAILQELQEVMGDDFATLRDDFLRDSSQRLQELAAAIASGNGPVVKSRAHQLKGIGSSFGAVRFAKLCGQLQEMGQSGELTHGAGKLDEIKTAFDEISRLLTRVC